jgi:hypothetical protein
LPIHVLPIRLVLYYVVLHPAILDAAVSLVNVVGALQVRNTDSAFEKLISPMQIGDPLDQIIFGEIHSDIIIVKLLIKIVK